MQQHLELPQAFADLGIEVRFLKALQKMRFETPSPIQVAMIPPALEGRDVIGQARTGTGKTAAFGLPIMQRIDPNDRLQAICLAPTRELAVQITGELTRLTEFAGIHVVAVYGGQRTQTQIHQLGKKPHFVVGTPGRVMDFMRRGILDIRQARFAILDEVDRMLDIGFREDIKNILGRINAKHQTIFVSATLDGEIRHLGERYLNDPLEVNVSQDKLTVDEVDQSYMTVDPMDKFRLLRLLLKQEKPAISIVFCNTKHAARKLAKKLHDAGVNAAEIHGDLMQKKRDRVMDQFRKHRISVLVATDLAARGIDVSKISHIINFDIPLDPEIYVHRIGRTARMGAKGVAISFITREQGKELTNIEKLINRELPVRKVDGFVASHRDDEHRTDQSAQAGRDNQAKDDPTKPKTPTRTLGGRFPTRRKRRL